MFENFMSADKILSLLIYTFYSIDVYKRQVDNNDSVLELFLDAIKNNRKFPDNGCSIVRQNHVIEIIDRIYESSRTGKAYEITSKFWGHFEFFKFIDNLPEDRPPLPLGGGRFLYLEMVPGFLPSAATQGTSFSPWSQPP